MNLVQQERQVPRLAAAQGRDEAYEAIQVVTRAETQGLLFNRYVGHDINQRASHVK